MSVDYRSQCLLFLAVREEPQSQKRARLAGSTVKGYALLSQVFLQQHPQVSDIFSYNGIHVLTNTQGDLIWRTASQNLLFELFEVHVRPENLCTESTTSDTINPLVVYTNAHSKEAIELILERHVTVITCSANEKIRFAEKIDEDNLNAVKNILTFGTDIGYSHSKKGTIVHYAVKRGQDALLKLLLQFGASANAERCYDGVTPLHLAAKKGLVETAIYLLQHGANVNARASDGELEDVTPLVLAVKNQHLEVGALLSAFGADINVEFNDGVTILDLVTENDINWNLCDFWTFWKHINNDILVAIRNILTSGPDISYQHFKGGTVLHVAVKKEQASLVKLLLRYGANPNAKRSDGMTPLHLAAKKGHVEIAQCLLHHGTNVSVRANHKKLRDVTALVLAVKNRHLEVSDLLIKFGADINVMFNNGSTILELVTQDGTDSDTLELREFEAEFNIRLEDGWTVRREFSEKSPDPNVLEFILKNRPSVNSERNRRAFCSVLSFCADVYKNVFQKMMEYGFTVDYDNVEDITALLFGAVHKNCFEIVEMLVGQLDDINKLYHPEFYDPRELTLLHMAAGHAGEDVIKLLLKYGADVNALCDIDRHPIDDAIEAGNASIVQFLIENGAKVNTSMWCAPSRRDLEIIEILFLAGADLNIGFEDADSPLSRAAFKGDMRVIKRLIKYGVCIGSGYVSPNDVLREALRGGQPHVFQFLLDYFFTDVDLIGSLRNIDSSGIRWWFRSYADAVARYLIKLESAGLKVLDLDLKSKWKIEFIGSNVSEDLKSTWDFDGENRGDFWRRCEAEIAEMKCQTIGNTNVLFYNVLTENIKLLTGYARNYVFIESMKAYDYEDRFPIYAEIVNYQFQKGFKRATLVKLSIEILDRLIPKFRSLPLIMKEEVLSYCRDQDLLFTAKKMPTKSEIFLKNPLFLALVAPE